MTTAQLLTPHGRGAIGVVLVHGPQAVAAVDACFSPATQGSLATSPPDTIRFGLWGGEELIVVRCAENRVEVHSHGGVAAPAAILASLAKQGVTTLPPTTSQQERSCEDEALHALTEATTERVAAVLLDQAAGALRRELLQILEAIEKGPPSVPLASLSALLRRYQFGAHLTEPWRVVLAGRPNVGKSSLINALVGYQRAIVYDRPGTTRDVVHATTAIQGWPILLADTAGLGLPGDHLEAASMDQARQTVASADLIVWVEEAAHLATSEVSRPIEPARAELRDNQPLLLVASKGDLAHASLPEGVLLTSATTGAGLPLLLDRIAEQLVPTPPPPGAPIPFLPHHRDRIEQAHNALQQQRPTEAIEKLQTLF